ncbi:MAG: hypothetical protein AB8C02_12440 [Halioglobus sp.]
MFLSILGRYKPPSFPSMAGAFMCACLLLVLPLAASAQEEADSHDSAEPAPSIWRVGPDQMLRFPSEAAAVASDGDVIEIEAGTYDNDYATWYQNGLTIRAVNGMAHLRSRGLIPNGKAIWVIAGSDTLIENIQFSGARVEDTNGAGIRHEGGNLRLHNTFFHNNEFSVLTGAQEGVSLDITDSRFWFHKRQSRYSHGIYVGALARLSITGSHFKGTDRGHQIKSRARENHILYNRIEDIPQGNSSRLIDLPNCGLSIVMGNDLHQAATTHNIDAIGYGAEGCEGREPRELALYVVNNTFINEASGGSLVRNHSEASTLVANNLIVGRGFHLLGKGDKVNNVKGSLSRAKKGVWAPSRKSRAIDRSQKVPPVEGRLLIPTKVFVPPAGSAARKTKGNLDIGARDYLGR